MIHSTNSGRERDMAKAGRQAGTDLGAPAEAAPAPRRDRAPRLSATARREQILSEAARFFAEFGFSGTTHGLAERLGIRQALLYKYFESKEALVEAVFQRVAAGRWTADYPALLADRARPLEDRLAEVYRLLAEEDDGLGLRLFVRAALDRHPVPPARGATLTSSIVAPLVAELRHEARVPDLGRLAMTRGERELVMLLHGAVMFRAIREHVYRAPLEEDRDAVVRLYIRTFLAGARETIRELHRRPPAVTPRLPATGRLKRPA
jgi:AcrR family transcriptional regulator